MNALRHVTVQTYEFYNTPCQRSEKHGGVARHDVRHDEVGRLHVVRPGGRGRVAEEALG
jgi:hypothetical protein